MPDFSREEEEGTRVAYSEPFQKPKMERFTKTTFKRLLFS